MKTNLGKSIYSLMAIFLLVLSSCSSDDEANADSRKVNCIVRFNYAENLMEAGLYPDLVNSCSLWVFDESGKLVKTFSESGEKVASKDYAINLSLTAGKYDFVTWFGIADEDLVKLKANPPASIDDLSLLLQLDTMVGGVCDTFSSDLPVIYNGHLSNVEILPTSYPDISRNITLNLIRDSKRIVLHLVGKNNDDLKNGKFDFKITKACNLIKWDNSPEETGNFFYIPTNDRDYDIITDDFTEYTHLLASFSTFPLSVKSDHRLIVTEGDDNKEIINISLIDALLKDKQMNYPDISDEEYIERRSYLTLYFSFNED